MMEITTNRPLDENILKVMKNTIEDTKNIQVLNIFINDNDVYGVYLNSLQHSLSFLQIPELTISTDIDGHNITFIELGFLLRNIYQTGKISLYNWLLHSSDIKCNANELYNDLLNCVRRNPPLNLIKSTIINNFDEAMETNDKKIVLGLVQQFYMLSEIDDFDVELDNEINDQNDMIKVKNQLNYLKQELQSKKYDKISEKKVNDINNLYVDLQLLQK